MLRRLTLSLDSLSDTEVIARVKEVQRILCALHNFTR